MTSTPSYSVPTTSSSSGHSMEKIELPIATEATPNQWVTWVGVDDPKNPMNWLLWKKMSTVMLMSCISFISYVAQVSSKDVCILTNV